MLLSTTKRLAWRVSHAIRLARARLACLTVADKKNVADIFVGDKCRRV